MKILVDMNLAPAWIAYFREHGLEAVHWSAVGDPRAPDRELLAWAAANGHVLFTHDLDFGALLALTSATGPSVLQVRGALDLLPDAIGGRVVATMRAYEAELVRGALVTLDGPAERVRVLPIVRRQSPG